MLIKAYGEYWSRSRVEWKRRNLRGVLKGKRYVNGWEQKGVYALYDHFTLVYVGQAYPRSLGKRLNEHRTDRFAERWDRFSWFGICDFDKKTNEPILPSHQRFAPETIVRSMELIAILLTDTPLNRARGKFPGSAKVWQRDSEADVGKPNLEKRISKLKSDLSELEDAVLKRSKKTGKRI